ncbi:uncharacterized protein Tco025E_08773 [Trypanosoma conorhini]|uniref:Uncharacterized protein n=1 Tax=Trypanosoma conorhini TaxID=83891 RepID=A0A3R7K615_9TRYP|nr:uncharacterized protein Tco025E_08773 [Trypanosoma conorhini]RNF00538.1 hypothetical protein Tco025E_08773 [Trypanosoma conorhini]
MSSAILFPSAGCGKRLLYAFGLCSACNGRCTSYRSRHHKAKAAEEGKPREEERSFSVADDDDTFLGMSRSVTDVEEQLRAWQQTHEKKTAVSCMEWRNLEANLLLLFPVVGVTLVTCFVFTLVPFIGRRHAAKEGLGLARRYAANLRRSRALVFASRFNPPLFSAFLTVWLLLCAANAVFQLMRLAADDPTWAERVLTTSDGFLTPAVLLYVAQYWGISSLLIHVLFTPRRYVIGSAVSVPPFLVSFYQTLRVTGEEVDAWPGTVVKATLAVSILTMVAFTVPWLHNEYRIAMQGIDAQTSLALGFRGQAEEKSKVKKRS